MSAPWAITCSRARHCAGGASDERRGPRHTSAPVLALLWTVSGAAAAGEVRVDTLLETEYAVAVDDAEAQKAELILTPELRWVGDAGTALTGRLRLRADGFDRLEPGEPNEPTSSAVSQRYALGDHAEAELRRLFVDLRLGTSFLRIGKQEVVWGQADGLKVLDVVNPQTFREFILDEFEDSRIPLWTVNWEVPVGPGTLQALWIPDKTYNDLPERGDLFELRSPLLVPRAPTGTPVAVEKPERPDDLFADDDYGLRWSAFLGGWDLTLNYFYHFRDNPVPFARVSADESVRIDQQYRRTHLFGATVSNSFGAFTLRSEVGYSTDAHFLAAGEGDRDGVVETGELSYVVGLDWNGPSDVFLSGQVFQSLVEPDSSRLQRDKLQTDFTFLARQSYFYRTLTAEIVLTQNANLGDGIVEPRVEWQYSSNLSFELRGAIFFGDDRGRFGQFDALDRMVVAIEYGF